ncbi:MAG: histidine kinase [Saprospiraceae bacterium]|nr:histidine kinase [Saprospiraceae bacterium]
MQRILYFTIVFSICWCHPIWANTDTVRLALQSDSTLLLAHQGELLIDSTSRLDIAAVKKAFALGKGLSPDEVILKDKYRNGAYNYWLHYTIRYDGETPLRLVLQTAKASADTLEIWQITDSTTIYQRRGAIALLGQHDLESILPFFHSAFLLTFTSQSACDLYIRYSVFYGIETVPTFTLRPADEAIAANGTAAMRHLAVRITFTAIILLSILFALIRLLQTRKIAYLYYALFGLFSVLYYGSFVRHIEIFRWDITPALHHFWWRPLFQSLGLVTYVLFIRSFLDTKVLYPKLYKYLTYYILSILLFIGIDRILVVFYGTRASYIFSNQFEELFHFLAILIMVQIIRTKNPLAVWVTIGSAFPILGALMMMLVKVNDEAFLAKYFFHATWISVPIGLVLESIFFWIALTYKDMLDIKAKQAAEIQLLQQREENARLREQATRQNLESRLQFLANQLKPHFTFNTLGAIRNVVAQGDTKNAEQYLLTFSIILRQALDFSDKETINLAEELDFAQRYIQMEQLRYPDLFTFELQTNNADLRFVSLPPLLLQPSIENAIKHGLLPKQGGGKLLIELQETPDFLLCRIEDNGVGRAASAKFNTTGTGHGLQITQNRIEAFNGLYSTHLTMQIIDKLDATQQPLGTVVEFCIPFEL